MRAFPISNGMDDPEVKPLESTPVSSTTDVNTPVQKQNTIRTYASDLADAMRESKGSIIKIALAEERRRGDTDIGWFSGKRKNIILILIATGLLLIGISIFLFAKTPATETVKLTENTSSIPQLLSTDTGVTLDITNLDKDGVKALIAKEITNSTPKLNTISRIMLVETKAGGTEKQFVTAGRLFETLGSSIPRALMRSFSDYPTIGIHAFNGNSLFMLFHTDSYTTTFSGMLAWEPTIFDDFYKLFGISPIGDRAGLFDAKWKDVIIKNQDTRALLDQKGNVILFYTFLGEDKSLLIITTKESTLTEVLNRLYATKIKR